MYVYMYVCIIYLYNASKWYMKKYTPKNADIP